MQILGISGSLRRASHNSRLLGVAGGLVPSGVSITEWSGLAALPAFDEDLESDAPLAVRELRGAIAGADALLISTPEYNASLPGALKNALDWASRPFPGSVLQDKPVAVIGASTGLFGAVWAQAEARKVLKASGARVVESELPVGMADAAFGEHGGLAEPELAQALRDLLGELALEIRAPLERQAA